MARTRSATRTRAASIRRWRTSCSRWPPIPCASTSARVFDLAAVTLRAHAGGDVLLVLARAVEAALRCRIEVDDVASRLASRPRGGARRRRCRGFALLQFACDFLRRGPRLLPLRRCARAQQGGNPEFPHRLIL